MFHTSLLSPYRKTPTHSLNFSQLPPDLINGEEEYKVEQIKVHWNFSRSKCLQYLIKWKGYPKSDNTWENATDIHASEITKEYHKHHPLQKIKGQLLSLLPSSLSPLPSPFALILNQLQSHYPYPCYQLNPHSPSTINCWWSSSDLYSTFTHGQHTSSMSSTLVESTTMPPSSDHSSTGTTARRNAASTTINRLAWPQPSSFPQPLAQLTQLSHTSFPSPSLTSHLLQSSTLPSYISTYVHQTNLTDLPKCPQMPLSIYQMSHLPRTLCLSWSDWSRVQNHLCHPVPLCQPLLPIPSLTQASSEPSLMGSSAPSCSERHRLPLKCVTLKIKLKGSTTVLSIMKTNLSEPLMDMSSMMGKFPSSTSPWAMESITPPNGSRGWTTAGLLASMRDRAPMSLHMLSTYMCKLTQLGMARKTP